MLTTLNLNGSMLLVNMICVPLLYCLFVVGIIFFLLCNVIMEEDQPFLFVPLLVLYWCIVINSINFGRLISRTFWRDVEINTFIM